MPPVLQTVRQQARKQLAELLEGLFNNIDDALFEMADRSRSDADQSLYFESMRELRLQRDHIRKTFAQRFAEGFETALAPTHARDTDFDMDTMSMVENDELEVTVAVAGIVSKVTSQHSLLVMQLTKRIDHLATEVEITERTNPMGPEMLSRAFVQALDNVDLDIKVRIILLKLFERFVMERLAGVYSDANQLLVEAGVMTDLKNIMRSPHPVHRNRSHRSTDPEAGPIAAATAGNAASVGTTAGPSFSVIQNLLAAARGPRRAAESMSAEAGRGGALTTADVLTVLSEAQRELDAPIDIESEPALLDLRDLVINRAAAIPAGREARLAQVEDDVVSFVGMLFDYILNDRNLAIPMKALIARLQLPIVKLAVMDRSFFEKPSHPARQLLNELSSAGIGWSSARELKRDAMYNMVESVVLRVMNGFQSDPALFADLLEELRAFVRTDAQKREQAEQRVKDHEKGRARTLSAKHVVQKLINQKASGLRLPVEVGRFLSDTWSRVLVLTCVKDGGRSQGWHDQTQTLDDLLWCLQPLSNLADIERRERQIPQLLDSLAAGMSQVQLSAVEIEKQVRDIERHLTSINGNDRAYLADDEAPPLDESFEVMEEIVLIPAAEQPDAAAGADVEPEYIEQIGKLREGSWVELAQVSGEIIRCKLSTIIDPGGRYIFVNRRGMKVAERSRRGLAIELKRGTLTILEESQVFDRALQAVIGNLRKINRSSTR